MKLQNDSLFAFLKYFEIFFRKIDIFEKLSHKNAIKRVGTIWTIFEPKKDDFQFQLVGNTVSMDIRPLTHLTKASTKRR